MDASTARVSMDRAKPGGPPVRPDTAPARRPPLARHIGPEPGGAEAHVPDLIDRHRAIRWHRAAQGSLDLRDELIDLSLGVPGPQSGDREPIRLPGRHDRIPFRASDAAPIAGPDTMTEYVGTAPPG